MPFRLIKGSFQLTYKNSANRTQGSKPDGDSIWFKPEKPAHLASIGGREPDYNQGELVNLRLESIDALELHFGGSHQQPSGALQSRDYLLETLGFSSVYYKPSSKIDLLVRSSQPKSIKGYIYVRTIDTYYRPVSFVFSGSTQRQSGKSYFLTKSHIKKSANAQLISAGLAYPAYYSGRSASGDIVGGLPTELRETMTSLMFKAKNKKAGIWKEDLTNKGFKASNQEQLAQLVLWPKIFRRMQSFLNSNPSSTSANAFITWLANSKFDDAVYIISRAELSNISRIFDVNSGKLKMRFQPHDILVVPG